MKIENQVCSLELAEKLKELGIKQESLFYWVPSFSTVNGKYEIKKWFVRKQNKANNRYNEISAFTATELLEMLPSIIYIPFDEETTRARKDLGCVEKDLLNLVYLSLDKDIDGNYSADYGDDGIGYVGCDSETIDTTDKNPANSLAKMLIYLKQNNLINN